MDTSLKDSQCMFNDANLKGSPIKSNDVFLNMSLKDLSIYPVKLMLIVTSLKDLHVKGYEKLFDTSIKVLATC